MPDDPLKARLLRLNHPRYLDHRADEIAQLERVAARGRRFELIEVGSNRGHFSLRLAELHHPRPVLALEWRRKWVSQLTRKARRRGLDNLVCLQADARIALPILAPPASVEALFVCYPDPWWKSRHGHRRLIDAPFLELASELLAEGGKLVVKTDAKVLRDSIVEALANVPALSQLEPTAWPDERRWAKTHRERQCLREGIATYRVVLGPS
jgi:tRNA (guanine-N7-)-methyltransferase